MSLALRFCRSSEQASSEASKRQRRQKKRGGGMLCGSSSSLCDLGALVQLQEFDLDLEKPTQQQPFGVEG